MTKMQWIASSEWVAMKTCPACGYLDLVDLIDRAGFCRFCLEARKRAAENTRSVVEQMKNQIAANEKAIRESQPEFPGVQS